MAFVGKLKIWFHKKKAKARSFGPKTSFFLKKNRLEFYLFCPSPAVLCSAESVRCVSAFSRDVSFSAKFCYWVEN